MTGSTLVQGVLAITVEGGGGLGGGGGKKVFFSRLGCVSILGLRIWEMALSSRRNAHFCKTNLDEFGHFWQKQRFDPLPAGPKFPANSQEALANSRKSDPKISWCQIGPLGAPRGSLLGHPGGASFQSCLAVWEQTGGAQMCLSPRRRAYFQK